MVISMPRSDRIIWWQEEDCVPMLSRMSLYSDRCGKAKNEDA